MSTNAHIARTSWRGIVLAVVLAAAMIAVLLRLGFAEAGSATSLSEGATPSTGATIQRFDFTPDQKTELANLTATPAKAALFRANLEKAFAGYGVKIGTGRMPFEKQADAASKGVTVRAATYSGSLNIEDVFAQGWSGDHWWLTMSYADAAYGGIGAATAGCMVYLPWFVCAPLGAILGSWVAGYSKASNHGVWAAVYRSGYITGGRW